MALLMDSLKTWQETGWGGDTPQKENFSDKMYDGETKIIHFIHPGNTTWSGGLTLTLCGNHV